MGHLHFGMPRVEDERDAPLCILARSGLHLGPDVAWTRQQECYAIGRADDETTGRAVAGEWAARARRATCCAGRGSTARRTQRKRSSRRSGRLPRRTRRRPTIRRAPASRVRPPSSRARIGPSQARARRSRRGGEGLRALRPQGAAQPLPRVRRGGVPRAGDARPWVHADRRHDGAAHRRRVRGRAARPPAADRGVGAAGERERGGRAVDPGREQRRRATTAALRDQAERLRRRAPGSARRGRRRGLRRAPRPCARCSASRRGSARPSSSCGRRAPPRSRRSAPILA